MTRWFIGCLILAAMSIATIVFTSVVLAPRSWPPASEHPEEWQACLAEMVDTPTPPACLTDTVTPKE